MNQEQSHINYQQQLLQEEGLDIKKYIFKILTNWYWFVISIFIGLSIAYYITRYADPVYTVSSSIIVEDESSGAGLENILKEYMGKNRKRKATVENEISILKSYKLSRQAIEELDDFDITYIGHGRIRERLLYTSTPFIVVLDTTKSNKFNYPVFISNVHNNSFQLEIDEQYSIDTNLQFGEKFSHNNFNFTIYKKENVSFGHMKYSFYINDLNKLANTYRNKLQTEVNDEKGSVLTLSVSGPVPQQEIDYLNKLGEIYINYGLEEKNKTSELSILFINEQLNSIKDSLKKAESKLQAFRIQNQIYNISKEGNLIFTKLDHYESEKSTLIIQKNYFGYISKYLNNKTNTNEIIAPSVIGIKDNLLNNLVIEFNHLYSEKQIIEYTANENNPNLDLINIQLKKTKETLKENVNTLIETNALAISNIEDKLKEIEIEMNRLPLNESRLLTFEREFNLNNDIFTYLLEKKAEAGITKASNIPDNKILDEGRIENAILVSPKKKMNYMIGGLLGALVPLIIILLLDYFNNRIIEKREIEEKTKVPIYGSIGHNDKDSEIPVFENPRSHLAEAFRSFRTHLQYSSPDKKTKVICITSTLSGEGKSFTAINLATILAMSGKKTLLISLDLRKPKIHQVFNIKNDKGISTYLINKNNFEEVIFSTAINNLSVSISGPVPPNPAELLETQQITDFFEKARNTFDFIVIDTPPLVIVTDALLIEKFSDLTIFVIRQNFSQKQVLDLINEFYYSKKIKNLGILVNDINTPGYYGYQYSYGYGYGYGYGYHYGRYGYSYRNGEGYYGDEPERPKWLKKLFKK